MPSSPPRHTLLYHPRAPRHGESGGGGARGVQLVECRGGGTFQEDVHGGGNAAPGPRSYRHRRSARGDHLDACDDQWRPLIQLLVGQLVQRYDSGDG